MRARAGRSPARPGPGGRSAADRTGWWVRAAARSHRGSWLTAGPPGVDLSRVRVPAAARRAGARHRPPDRESAIRRRASSAPQSPRDPAEPRAACEAGREPEQQASSAPQSLWDLAEPRAACEAGRKAEQQASSAPQSPRDPAEPQPACEAGREVEQRLAPGGVASCQEPRRRASPLRCSTPVASPAERPRSRHRRAARAGPPWRATGGGRRLRSRPGTRAGAAFASGDRAAGSRPGSRLRPAAASARRP